MNHSSQTDTLTLLADHDRQTYFTIFFLFWLSYCPVGWPAQKWGQQKIFYDITCCFQPRICTIGCDDSRVNDSHSFILKCKIVLPQWVFEWGIIWLSMATVLAALFIGHLLVIRYSHPIGNALHTYIRDANSLHICCK